jgi:glycosyltransferase involved in cell wall biosynthesis
MTLSVVIPSCKDHLLQKTINSLSENSGPDTEILPILDGYDEDIPNTPKVRVIRLKENKGMRGAINAGLAEAKGDFIMKSDSHCAYAPGFDEELIGACKDNYLMIPRRHSLNEETWARSDTRPAYDHHVLSFPYVGHYGNDMAVITDRQRSRERLDIPIDDTMIFQGSCYLANRKYFMEHVGFLDDRPETYGSFACEPAEVGLKYWLGGGEVKVNKNTWYAHLHKATRHYQAGLYGINYKRGKGAVSGHTYATRHWLLNEEPNMIHDFKWLLDKFWPVPTWPEDWEAQCLLSKLLYA